MAHTLEYYPPRKMTVIKDMVERPAHYTEGRSIEPIDVIEDWKLDYHLGNALKYISRAGRKDELKQDLQKAVWYLNRRISKL